MDEQQLRTLLKEFFGGADNARKRELEASLEAFKARPDASALCFDFIASSVDPYVLWFATSVFEDLVTRRWSTLANEDQLRLRSFVFQYLVSHYGQLPQFVSSKMAGVVVRIGKLTFPASYPEYFRDLEQAVRQLQTCTLGLVLIRFTVEEFVREDVNLPVGRKLELRRLLAEQLPSLLALLTSVLQTAHGAALLAVDPEGHGSIEQASLALAALLQLVSWAPLNDHMKPELMTVLFQFVALGGCDNTALREAAILPSGEAVRCLTELLAKRCVPHQFEGFVMDVAQSMLMLLQGMIGSDSGAVASEPTAAGRLSTLDVDFLNKVTEFVFVFLTQHLARITADAAFPMGAFLQLLCTFTFQQPSADGLLRCLRLWMLFVDHFAEDGTDEAVGAYTGGLKHVMLTLVECMQLSSNGEALGIFSQDPGHSTERDGCTGVDLNGGESDDNDDDDSAELRVESEFEEFIRECQTLVVGIAALPQCCSCLVERLFPLVRQNANTLRDAMAVGVGGGGDALVQPAEDLSTLLGVLGRVAPSFVAQGGQLTGFWQLLDTTLQLGRFACENRLHTRGAVFVRFCVTTYKSLLCFVQQIPLVAPSRESVEALDATLELTLAAFNETNIVPAPEALLLAAGRVLAFLFCNRSFVPGSNRPFVFSVVERPAVRALFEASSGTGGVLSLRFNTLCQAVPPGVQRLLCRAVTTALLLSSELRTAPGAEEEACSNAFSAFLSPLVASVQSTTAHPAKVRQSLSLLTVVCRSARNARSASKVRLVAILRPALTESTTMLQTLIAQATCGELNGAKNSGNRRCALGVIHELLRLLLAVFANIRRQTGVEFAKQAASAFLAIFRNNDGSLSRELANANGRLGVTVMWHFIRLLAELVGEPTRCFDSILQEVLTVVTNDIFPIAVNNELAAVEFMPPFLDLVERLLLHHWRFFVVAANNSGAAVAQGRVFVSEARRADFFRLLEAVGTCFQHSSPALFRRGCRLLGRLHDAHRLYDFGGFNESLRRSTMQALLNALVGGLHALLHDDIAATFFAIASTDFNEFFNNFLPSFVGQSDRLSDGDKRTLVVGWSQDADSPSFTANMSKFVNDSRYLLSQQR